MTALLVQPSLTLLEKSLAILGVLTSVAGTPLEAAWIIAQGVPRPSLRKHLLFTLARRGSTRLTIPQLRWLAGGSTIQNFERWSKDHDIEPRSITLSNSQTLQVDTKAYWIGDPCAQNIILYFHGGGYALPCNKGAFDYLSTIIDGAAANQPSKSLAVLVLVYDFIPAYQYPHQLKQAVELLRYTMVDLGRDPDQITLMGDSAGAHLVLGVLAHVISPSPRIPSLYLHSPLRMVVAASPAVTSDELPASVHHLEVFDLTTVVGHKEVRSTFLEPGDKPDEWMDYLNSPAGFWKNLHHVVKDMLVTASKYELMSHDICAQVDRMRAEVQSDAEEVGAAKGTQAKAPRIELYISDSDFHAEPFGGQAAGFPECGTARVLRSFIVERLL